LLVRHSADYFVPYDYQGRVRTVVAELTTGRTQSSSLTYATIQRRVVISEPLLTPSLSQHAVATDRSLTSRRRHRAVVSDLSLPLRSADVLSRLVGSSAAALIPYR